jgi:hypothetical protein
MIIIFSPAAGLKSGQFDRERNFEKANIEYRMSKECILSISEKTERSDSILRNSLFDILRFAVQSSRQPQDLPLCSN